MLGYGLLFLLAAMVGAATASKNEGNCFHRTNDQIRTDTPSSEWFPCAGTASSPGGHQLCCKVGDMCGEDSLCRTPDVKEGNEWYVGGCTDITYTDAMCSKDCTSYKQTWSTYNATGHGYWACCGDYDCADGKPTTRMFDAVSPAKWSAIPQPGKGGLSKGAEIGIGVGVGVVVLAIIGGIVGFLWRRRRQTKKPPTFGRSAKRQYEQIGPQGDVMMTAPFVPSGENQPYSRPSSPMPSQLAPGYSDRAQSTPRYDDPTQGKSETLHQPPTD